MRLIDADEVKDTLALLIWENPYFPEDFEKIIDDSPTIDPVKHGRWTCGGDGIVECSVCEERFFSENLYPRHYCPNCGARMDANE